MKFFLFGMIFAFADGMKPALIQDDPEIIHFVVKKNGGFPGNPLPVLIYRQVIKFQTNGPGSAEICQDIISKNGWTNNWTDSVFPFDHFHSNTHEVLCINSGNVHLLLGGPGGIEQQLFFGDIIILPAGVAHKKISSSDGFSCVGGYPDGKKYDMKYANEDEDDVLKNIAGVPLPVKDPVFGTPAPLNKFWK